MIRSTCPIIMSLCLLLVFEHAHANTLTVSDTSGCTSDTVTVTIMMANSTTPVDAFGLRLNYDSSALQYQSCSQGTLNPGWAVFNCNGSTAGLVVVGGFTMSSIPAGSNGSLVTVTFTILCGSCTNGQTFGMTLTNLVDDLVGFTVDNGVFTYTCPATVTPTRTPTPTLTPSPTPTRTPTMTPDPSNIISVTDAQGCTSETIQTAVELNIPSFAVDDFNFYLSFDTSALDFSSYSAGMLLPPGGWSMFTCVESSPGVLHISGFSMSALPSGSSGSLILLNFSVLCSSCSNGQTFPLTLFDLAADISGFTVDNGVFTYTCPATVTPTRTPTMTPDPSNIISVTDAQGCTSETIQTAVELNIPSFAVDDFNFYLSFDTSALDFSSYSAGMLLPPGGWSMFTCVESSPGVLHISGFSMSALPSGSSGSLILLNFSVLCSSCSNGQTFPLTLFDLAADISGFTVDNGVFTFCPSTPTPTSTPMHDLLLVQNVSGCAEDVIVVRVFATNPQTAVDSFQFRLYFNSSALSYNEQYNAGTFAPAGGWNTFSCNQVAAGQIEISGTASSPVSAGSTGSLVLLGFTVQCDTCSSGQTFGLLAGNLSGDLLDFDINQGIFTFCPATATPTPPAAVPASGTISTTVLIFFVSLLLVANTLRRHH